MVNPQRANAVDFYRQMEKEQIGCPICGGERHEQLFHGDRYRMGITTVGCRRCGLIFVNPRPTPMAMNLFYQRHYRKFYESVERPTDEYVNAGPFRARAEYVVNALHEFTSNYTDAKLLDIGCAEGTLLKHLGKAFPKFTLYGMEPDPNFADYARAQAAAVEVFSCDFHSFFGENNQKFDVVTLTHVLEHILDPICVLRCIRDILRKDGYLYVEVPNVADLRAVGVGNIHLGHVLSFDPQSLKHALHVAGFRVEQFYEGDLPAMTPAMAAICRIDEREFVPRYPLPDLKQKFNRYRQAICGIEPRKNWLWRKLAG
jgi:2-polyprenyl-3-methyl-5-hydroxy-6-metoxy-1,4-benzoquinol methylase